MKKNKLFAVLLSLTAFVVFFCNSASAQLRGVDR